MNINEYKLLLKVNDYLTKVLPQDRLEEAIEIFLLGYLLHKGEAPILSQYGSVLFDNDGGFTQYIQTLYNTIDIS